MNQEEYALLKRHGFERCQPTRGFMNCEAIIVSLDALVSLLQKIEKPIAEKAAGAFEPPPPGTKPYDS